MRLKDKVAIVTGAASGMGASTARIFAREGAFVILTDMNDEDGQKVAREIGNRAQFVHHDVSKEADEEATEDNRRTWLAGDALFLISIGGAP